MIARRDPPLDACPFIDDNDSRCASHFRLSHLADAFNCIGGYRACSTYWGLARSAPERLITLTCHGRSLQPTGT